MFEAFVKASEPPRRAGAGWLVSAVVHGVLLGGFALSARTPVITERAWALLVSQDPIYQPVRLVTASELRRSGVTLGGKAAPSVVDILPPRRKTRPETTPRPEADSELLALAAASSAHTERPEEPAAPEDFGEPHPGSGEASVGKPEAWTRAGADSMWRPVPESAPSFAAVAPSGFKITPLPDRIDMNQAAYYRTYDNFPSLPGGVWPAGKNRYALDAEVCVSARGEVSRVIVRSSSTPGIDRYVVAAIQSWRYRPRVVSGSALPFCHPIRIVYARG